MFNPLSNAPQPRRASDRSQPREIALSKIPEVTLTFWIIKIAATTLAKQAEMPFR